MSPLPENPQGYEQNSDARLHNNPPAVLQLVPRLLNAPLSSRTSDQMVRLTARVPDVVPPIINHQEQGLENRVLNTIEQAKSTDQVLLARLRNEGTTDYRMAA